MGHGSKVWVFWSFLKIWVFYGFSPWLKLGGLLKNRQWYLVIHLNRNGKTKYQHVEPLRTVIMASLPKSGFVWKI